jgi:ATP-binding cassette subfamily C protein LapB
MAEATVNVGGAQSLGDDLKDRGVKDPGLKFVESFLWLTSVLSTYVPGVVKLQRHERQRMAAALHSGNGLAGTLLSLFRLVGIEESGWHDAPNEAEMPMVAVIPGEGYQVVYGRSSDSDWMADCSKGRVRVAAWPKGTMFAAAHARPAQSGARTALVMFLKALRADMGWVVYAVLASLLASVLALGTSMYSMQVYDRVMGTGAISTLIVLTIGVFIAIIIELGTKLARSSIVDKASSELDQTCSYEVFARLLSIRLDQRPGSVGTLASQIRSYESVRSFAISLILFLTADGPFALFFLAVIFLLAGPMVAAVPLAFMVLSVVVGLMFKRSIDKATKGQVTSGNRRNGLLVETIEGAESIKASGSGWYILGRWNELSKQNISEGMTIKHLNEMSTHIAAGLQQVSYVGLVCAGAWIASTTSDLTTGAIIACSILSGRASAPISMIPGLIVQWAHAKMALEQLEGIYKLERDNHGVESPLTPETIAGKIHLDGVKFVYQGQVTALSVERLTIKQGEKVAIIGPVGAGKSTLLRLMGGLIKPQRGRVFLDDLDVQQISIERCAELIGYLSQKVNLIGGTLRENLLMGLAPIAEGDVISVCQATGLAVLIGKRSEGLDLMISEGGGGLSGGQMQLVAFTRLLLSRPSVWLLDEPTAAMDEVTESRCIAALKNTIQSDQTLVLVTHKAQMLSLVDRIVVLGPEGILADGPRDAVLAHMRNPQPIVVQKVDAARSPAGGAV